MTHSASSIPGLTSLFSTSTSLLAAGRPVADVMHHIEQAVNTLREDPDYQPYRAILQGLDDVTKGAPSSSAELAEDLYQLSTALEFVTHDARTRTDLRLSIMGLTRLIQMGCAGPKPAGGLFARGAAGDIIGENRWRTLAALTGGVYHDVKGIISALEIITPLWIEEAQLIAERPASEHDRSQLNAHLEKLQGKCARLHRLLAPIQLALYLSGTSMMRRELINEPFRNGDMDRLARALDSLQNRLKRASDIVGRLAELESKWENMISQIAGWRRMLENSVDLLKSLVLIHAGSGDRLRIPVSLHDSLDPAMLRSVLGKRIELTIHLEPDPGLVTGPACHIQQVLYNLVVNAREATIGPGTVIISTQRTFLKESRPHARPGEYMVLSVQDTGSGIPKNLLPDIFKPGVSGKGSSGLGLSVIQEIVQGLGGFIEVQSSTKNPRGTRFSVYFPI
ncbi:MAG TPA: ATP-binding protein [bacterium]|nr:ATP-binding protein [bacterium]